jgi:flagellar protein FliJ
VDRFNFKFQKVLDYKVTIEDKRKEEFVTALRESLKQEKILDELVSQKQKTVNNTTKLKTVIEYQSFTRYLELLYKKIENQKQNLHNANEFMEVKKQELLKSTSDRKVMEMLRDKAKTEFDLEVANKEQRLNDDFALFAYIRHERR